MPARRQHSATASCASGRGGSIMPTRPTEVRPFSSFSLVSSSGTSSIILIGDRQHPQGVWRLISSLIAWAAVTQVRRRCTAAASTSNAPLTMTRHLAVDAVDRGHQLAVGVKGQFRQAGIFAVPARPCSMPFLRAAATMAVSVGSPMCFSRAVLNGDGAVAAQSAVSQQRAGAVLAVRDDAVRRSTPSTTDLHQRSCGSGSGCRSYPSR